MQNKRSTGTEYEAKTAEYLIQQGYSILQRNYRCRFGEIDIIAKDGKYLVFVEVKYRGTTACGSPFEAVDYKKQKKISKVAQYYCMKHGYDETMPCRFDVAGFRQDQILYITNAFDFSC